VTTVTPDARVRALDRRRARLQHSFRQLGDRLGGIRTASTSRSGIRGRSRLPAHFTADDNGPEKACKSTLQEAWGLPRRADVPRRHERASGFAQKGLDQIVAVESLRLLDAQFIFLGAGEAQFETRCASSRPNFPTRIAWNTAPDGLGDEAGYAAHRIWVMPDHGVVIFSDGQS